MVVDDEIWYVCDVCVLCVGDLGFDFVQICFCFKKLFNQIGLYVCFFGNLDQNGCVGQIFIIYEICLEKLFDNIVLDVVCLGLQDQLMVIQGIWGQFDGVKVEWDVFFNVCCFDLVVECIGLFDVVEFVVQVLLLVFVFFW